MTKRGKGRPYLNALLLAERVYIDKDSKNHVIAGTFNQIKADRFPVVHVGSWLYLNISDFQGQHTLSLHLVRASDGAELAKSADFPISQDDRLKHFEVRIQLPPLEFHEPGQYAIEVMWNGDYLIGRCKIAVEKKEA